MVNIMVIESREGDGLVQEILDFISLKTKCQVIKLPFCDNNTTSDHTLSFPGLKIKRNEQAAYRNGKQVQMSHQEFCLLDYLAEHPGWVFSKEQIYGAVYHEEGEGIMDNAVYCLVHSLRKKIETDSKHPEYIQTVRGAGYKFTIPEE